MIRVLIGVFMLVGGSAAGLWLDAHLFKSWIMNPWFHTISFVVGLMMVKLVIISNRNTGRLLARTVSQLYSEKLIHKKLEMGRNEC